MKQAEVILVDGTFWDENDMEKAGVCNKKAQEMGHLPFLKLRKTLDEMTHARKILIHINNTNPVLEENSEESKTLRELGIEVAFDGMEIRL